MIKPLYLFALMPVLVGPGAVATAQQYPVMDRIANKVVEKYQNRRANSCRRTGASRIHRENRRSYSVCAATRRCAGPLSTEWLRPSPTKCLSAA
jgi:hypothetical protein